MGSVSSRCWEVICSSTFGFVWTWAFEFIFIVSLLSLLWRFLATIDDSGYCIFWRVRIRWLKLIVSYYRMLVRSWNSLECSLLLVGIISILLSAALLEVIDALKNALFWFHFGLCFIIDGARFYWNSKFDSMFKPLNWLIRFWFQAVPVMFLRFSRNPATRHFLGTETAVLGVSLNCRWLGILNCL